MHLSRQTDVVSSRVDPVNKRTFEFNTKPQQHFLKIKAY